MRRQIARHRPGRRDPGRRLPADAARDTRWPAVAAAHAGWRGLAGARASIAALGGDPAALAWLGPAIGRVTEVGAEVHCAFTQQDPAAAQAFAGNARGRWQCDLTLLARQRLARAGVTQVFGGNWCTYSDPVRFFSYRRDGQCGRMAALIWLT
jgi:copper oxidase (laccase) domain-containing protein